MNFLPVLTKAVGYLPLAVSGAEMVFGGKAGKQKSANVAEAFNTLLNVREAIVGKEIADSDMFQAGLGEAISGVVKMMNASVWNKDKTDKADKADKTDKTAA